MPTSRKNKKRRDPRLTKPVLRAVHRLTIILDEHRAAVNAHASNLESLRAYLRPLVLAHKDLYPADMLPTPELPVEDVHPLYGPKTELNVDAYDQSVEDKAFDDHEADGA